MLDQERCCDHAYTIVHPTGRPQLTHAGIDDRIASVPARPGLELRVTPRPWEIRELRAEWFIGQARPVEQQVVREFAPDEFL